MLCSFVPLGVFPCSAGVVWSDDFDDGDYDGWIIQYGKWMLVDNALQALYSPDTFQFGAAIFHPSSTAYGTWSYDAYNTQPLMHEVFIIKPNEVFPASEYYDYYLAIKLAPIKPEFFFGKDLGENIALPISVWSADSDIAGSWHHIDITRDSDGRFRIYLNRMLIIDVVDTSITSSKYLGIYSEPDGPKIDNIVVSDTIDIHPSWISCSVSTENIPVGDAVTISGSIQTVSGSIPPPSGVPVTLSYKMVGSWSPLATVTSAADASYTHTWTPTMVDSYQLRVSWAGDSSFGGATSSEVPLTVSKMSTTLSCSMSSPEVTEGEFVTVSGALSPTISGATVTLTYRKPDGSTVTRTVTTGVDGSYSDSYQPEGEGSWRVTASWDGDSTHEGSSCSSQSFTVKSGGCIIATATYGSELSPQVQFLRGFRDNTVYSTFAGSSFMTVFNGFYYSFSPSVASVISENSVLRDMMKVVLYPLIGSLQVSSAVFSVFSFLPELGIIVAGLIASSLIGIIYFLPIALILSYFRKFKVSEKTIRWMGLIWFSSVLTLAIAEGFHAPSIMIVSTGVFVLVTIATATLTSLRIVSKRLIQ